VLIEASTTSDPHCSTHGWLRLCASRAVCPKFRYVGYMDTDLTMLTQLSRTVSSCFATLRQLRNIRRSVTRPVLLSLVVSLVLTRLDYGSVLLAGLPRIQLDRLQSVLNAAARLVHSSRKYYHITPLLRELHWLRVPERIDFRLAVIVFRCLHGQGAQ